MRAGRHGAQRQPRQLPCAAEQKLEARGSIFNMSSPIRSSYSALQLFIGALSPGARAGAPSSQRGPNLVVYKLRLFSKDVAYNDDQNVIHAMAGSLLDKFEEKELQFLSKVENQEPIQWRIEQIDYKFCDKAVWIITEEAGCQRSPAIKDMELK
ncbi:hypothetical protein U9M48_003555 [Paspalum notatum var. saurae]|uniref:Uncharacterized protein n=1 Tax=Paspalum notatum var. saurae TaxID=547442 RepID=A0AAQ3SGZ3_PASNO